MATLHRPRMTGSHWYTRDGEPMHEVPRADGSGTRQTTLADARKLGLLPSVTNVLSVIAKPGLTAWREQRVIDAVLATERTPGESEQYWRERVLSAAEEQTAEAADLGSAIHAALSGDAPPPENYAGAVAEAQRLAIQLCDGREIMRERVLVHEALGYAGRCDLYAVHPADGDSAVVVIDYKTRKSDPGKPMRTWESEPLQLAAYADCVADLNYRDARLYNVLISTTEPGRVEVVAHEPSDVPTYMEAYRACLSIWCYLKGYTP